ncbi:MAG: hypothetical protein H0X65_10645 [Gemmatimonadetes bacterium]|nr:hypothetical protein [Gemmatimonadota bacterium]
MDFEQMKVIWDTQDERPMYAVDERALHEAVRRRSRSFRGIITVSRLAVVLTSFVLGVLFLVEPLATGASYHRLASGAILLLLGAAQGAALLRTRGGESRFPQSLLGDLDRAIWRVNEAIAWARALRRWYIPPFIAAVTIDVAFRTSLQSVLLWLLVIAILALASRSVEWELRSWHLPLKRRLEALRQTFIEQEK